MKPPFPYFGGKIRIADRVAALLPKHEHYIEPFAGGLSVLFAKPPSTHETVNDLDGYLMTFWRVLRDRLPELERACALTPHSRGEMEHADFKADGLDEVEIARRIWIKLSQSRGGSLRSSGWRFYCRPAGTHTSMPGYLAAYVGRFAPVAERLTNVSLECRPATELISKYGADPACLIYADPPYLGSTRAGGSWRYAHEMPHEEQHIELSAYLHECKASVVLSGYHSPLYDELYTDWDRHEIKAMTGRADAATEESGLSPYRTEVLWSNRPFDRAPTLFAIDEALDA